MPKRVEIQVLEQQLTPQERRLAHLLASDPDRPMWEAGWKAGYCQADPEGPEPAPSSLERKKLADSAGRARKRPHVLAEIRRIRNAGAAEVVREAKAKTHPTSEDEQALKVIVAAGERVLDRAVAEHDAVVLGASLLSLKLRAAHADMGDFVDWDSDSATVKGKNELTPEQRQLIRELSFHPTCGKCGAEHATPGVTIKLEPRAQFAAMATKQLGLEAASKVELAGAGGGPIQVQAELGLSWATIQAVRHAIIGRPPQARE